VIEMRVFQ